MAERKYYLFCDDDCKFEGMTKEQILAAIAEATGYLPSGADVVITKIRESNANKALSFWLGTETEFNALGATADCLRVKVDENGKVYFSYGGKLYADDIAEGAVSKTFETVVPTSGWTQYVNYAVNVFEVSGLESGDAPFVDLNLAGKSGEELVELNEVWGNVLRAGVDSSGRFYIYFTEIPTMAIPIKIWVVRK